MHPLSSRYGGVKCPSVPRRYGFPYGQKCVGRQFCTDSDTEKNAVLEFENRLLVQVGRCKLRILSAPGTRCSQRNRKAWHWRRSTFYVLLIRTTTRTYIFKKYQKADYAVWYYHTILSHMFSRRAPRQVQERSRRTTRWPTSCGSTRPAASAAARTPTRPGQSVKLCRSCDTKYQILKKSGKGGYQMDGKWLWKH